ncbi:Hypothetical predicted protein [Cloeon dipterum]|nr:Hypothetical predicted protein [Cloeon dipterum]
MKNIVTKLIATKCAKLWREEMEMKVLMVPALRIYLATTRPRKVNLTAFLSFCPKRLKYQYLKMSVEKISEVAADIEELSLVHTDRNDPDFSHTADGELLQALRRFKRLKVLRIEEICRINMIDLNELCQNLPDLEYLHVHITDDVDQFDFEGLYIAEILKSAIPKLQVFLFDTTGQESAMNALTKCCAENLPNLRVIQDFSSRFSSFEDYESSNEITCTSGSSNLRHLTVKFDFVESCDHLPSAFPLITHLKILWRPNVNAEEYNLTALLQLTHLENLEFSNVPKDIFHLFVEKFGLNLLEISINYDNDVGDEWVELSTGYSLSHLLASCPKLERLEFRANFKEDLEPITFPSNFKEIKMMFMSLYDNEHLRLTDILRAPNLEKITFYDCYFDIEDLRSAITFIREKKMLSKLKELHFALFTTVNTFNSDCFKEIAAFIKCVAASLPDIQVISLDIFYLNGFIGYAPLARSMDIGRVTNDEIFFITEFFQTQIVSSGFVESFVDEELIAILEDYRC